MGGTFRANEGKIVEAIENFKREFLKIPVSDADWIDYIDRSECCGQPTIGVNDEFPLRLSRDKLNHVKEAGAQANVTIRPACHMMYDLYRPRNKKAFGESFGIPALHHLQLLGLAMGFGSDELGFRGNGVIADGISNLKYGTQGVS